MYNSNIESINDADCFNEGTLILCVTETGEKIYVRVEDLKPGMLVDTYITGPKVVESIGKTIRRNNSNSTNGMYKMRRTREMPDHLILTGGHCILIDRNVITTEQKLIQIKSYRINFSIQDKKGLLACVSDEFTKIHDDKDYTCYNFALIGDDKKERFGVYANGILCETPSVEQISKMGFDSFESV
jgi:hypothetical protein